MADADTARASNPLAASARGISLAGLVLFAVYLSILVGSLFPLKLLDPLWQLRLGTALINAAPFPLVGLALLHLANSIDPLDPLLTSRRRGAAQLAVLAALGFVLLVPLMTVDAIQQQRNQSVSQADQIAGADGRIRAVREAVAAATSTADLNNRLVVLKGPVLNDSDRKQPLPVIKAQVNALLDQLSAQLASQRQMTPPASPLLLLPDLLRNAFASLALAVGFAGLARRPQVSVSLLEELQRWWLASVRRSNAGPKAPPAWRRSLARSWNQWRARWRRR